MIDRLRAYVADAIAKRRAYRRLVAEIECMTHNDLIEIGAFRSDLFNNARRQVYG